MSQQHDEKITKFQELSKKLDADRNKHVRYALLVARDALFIALDGGKLKLCPQWPQTIDAIPTKDSLVPRQEHVLTIFVASPDDVGDERFKLEEVINELNVTWSRNLGLRLDLVRWETHAVPGIGDDAQSVINEQMPDDYDLFVGIMWCRYGTPTGRYGSGTFEEFLRAKTRYDADPSGIKLMLYFKDEPLSPSRLDPDQLSKVNEFRNSLGDEGVLYWNFTNIEQFEKLVRVHLARQVQAWKPRTDGSKATSHRDQSNERTTQQQKADPDEEFGILDLIEISEEQFLILEKISDRIAKATDDLTTAISENAEDIKNLPQDERGNVSPKLAKRLIARAADDLTQYTVRIEAELPLFRQAFNTGMNAIVHGMSLSADLQSEGRIADESVEALTSIGTLRETLTSTEESLSGFRQAIADLPPMTSKLNKAKRGTTSILDRMLDEFKNGQALLQEAETAVRKLLSDEAPHGNSF